MRGLACLMAGLLAAVGAGGSAAAAPATRVVALAPHLAELAWAAGAGDLLVGAVAWSDYPPPVRALPRVGDAFSIDDERVAALAPDLVLAWSGGTPPAVIERLRGRGFRVEALASGGLEDVADHLRAIGRWTGRDAIAQAAADEFLAGLGALARAREGREPVRVFYQISADPLYTVGGDQVITRILELCGGRNIFADLESLAAVVDVEAVVARDPQVILAAAGAGEGLARWHAWKGLAAVRHGNLFRVDGDLVSRPSPRLLEGARAVCGHLDSARARISGR